MARLELIAGDFGTGSATYDAGEFRFPKGRLQSVANVTDIEVNATVIQKHMGRAILDGARNAATFAPVAMLVGVFAAPIAIVGTIGVAAAAFGGAIGLLGGGPETKALVQIKFAQGTAIIAICEQETAETIKNDAALMQAQAERERARLAPPKKGWFSGWSSAEPEPDSRLPPPPAVALIEPPRTEPGILDTVTENLSAATTAVTTTAVETTGQAITGAMAFAKRMTGYGEK